MSSKYPVVAPLLLLLVLLVLAPASVVAQEGLYAPSVPGDAALVRVVNATGHSLTFDVGPRRFPDVSAYSVTPYRPLAGDVALLLHAGAREVLSASPGAFLSIVLLPDTLIVVSDERHTDPARAQLVVYNLSDGPVDFVAVDPSAVLVAGVKPGASAARVVNAISLTAGATVASDDGVASSTIFQATRELRRGESYSLFILGSSAEPHGFVAQASVAAD